MQLLEQKGQSLQISEPYFDEIWRNNFPNNLVDSDNIICEECEKFKMQFKNASAAEKQNLLNRHKQHLDTAKLEREVSLKWRWQSIISPLQYLSICGDYATGKMIPKPPQMPFSYKMKALYKVHFCGWLVDGIDKVYYQLHGEHWNESANTVISGNFMLNNFKIAITHCTQPLGLHELLQMLSNLPPCLYLTFDNHDTNKNQFVFAYLAELVE